MRIVCLVFFLLFSFGLFGQGLVVKAGRKDDLAAIRWVSNDKAIFTKLWTDSLLIERYEGEALSARFFLPPLKHRVEDQDKLTEEGVLFLNTISHWIQGDTLPESLLSLLLLQLDMDFSLACQLGMGWLDSSSASLMNLNYVLKIEGCSPLSFSVDNEKELLPEILSDSVLVFHDAPVVLRWRHQADYVSYQIRRNELHSGDYRLVKDRILPLFTDLNSDSLFFPDTTIDASEIFNYFIRGKDVFGNFGEWSLPVQVAFEPCSADELLIRQVELKDSSWTLFVSGMPSGQIHSEVFFSQQINGNTIPLAATQSGQDAWVIHDPPDKSGYLVFCSGEEGCQKCSSPFRVIVKDSIAPPQINHIDARLSRKDSLINIHWTASHEKEVKGYSVYRRFRRNDEWVQLNTFFLTDTSFTDSSACTVKSDSVFYYVTVSDYWYNQSTPSRQTACPLLFVKPLLPPVIGSVDQTEFGNRIVVFIDSTVLGQWTLYRGDQKEKKILRQGLSSTSEIEWVDTLPSRQRQVYYQISFCYQAQCVFSEKYWTKAPSKIMPGNPAGLTATKAVNRRIVNINWRYGGHGDVQRVHLYRITDGGQPEWLYSSSPVVRDYADKKIYPGHRYSYLLILEKKDGEKFPVKGDQEMIF